MRRRGSGRRRTELSVSLDESFRILRSNVEIALVDLEPPIVIVTSAHPAEGKTWTAVGLSRSLASAGRRVVLVDLDLRRPGVHSTLGAHNERGVTDVLLETRTLEECLQFIEFDRGIPGRGIYVLPTGPPVNEPTELLGTRRTAHLLEALAAQADLVLIDTPPVLPVADTLVIGRMAAGAVLVVEAGKTSIPAVNRTVDSLIRNQTRVLGVVVNKATPSHEAYDYTSGYSYGYTPEPGQAHTDNGGGQNAAPHGAELS